MGAQVNKHIVFDPHKGSPVVPFIAHGYNCQGCAGAFMHVTHGNQWWVSTGSSWFPVSEKEVPAEYVGKLLLLET